MTQNTPLHRACIAVARNVLWRNGATSSDIVETLARKFQAIAEEHQDFVRKQREHDDVIADAVEYIGHVHALPTGTDTEWFRHQLAALIEIAVPNTGLSEDAAKLLPHLQEGIRESQADVPVQRSALRMEDEEAKEIRRLEEAGVEHGAVSDLLDLVEKLYHGDPLDDRDKRLFQLAALAAPMTRQARS
ncbi:hypothetical protein GNZ12_26790 [Paraburkholderia sp. 1N]|uniref:Uncharacterized protein n=1 Tax=Paraburkholderia solitsugae TaxID=2675748 RepID=A0ABX2BVF2_9BURK|nr:hypothetical protein [Paraburkholderia solitsugae]NPT44859.1 hypothetical protein [Paraburkholderia solitsugae]